jgi:hypothetical protein
MTRVLATALALAVFAAPLMPVAVFAGKTGSHSHFRNEFHPYPQHYDGNAPPEYYPDCLPWSPQLRTYVWICGRPYPPGYPVIK